MMDIYNIYKKYKKEHRKEKSLALLYAMQEIELRIKNADVDAGFMKAYKFYKALFSACSIVIPSMVFGTATGIICSVINNFVAKIKDIYLLTLSNLLFMSIGFLGVIFIYLLSWKHTLVFVLLPYTTELMEERIKEYNNSIFAQQAKPTHKVTVKRRRRANHAKKREKTNRLPVY